MAAPDPGELSAAITRVMRPLESDDDLERVIERVGRARIVLLGESTCGTREFHALRAALTRKLISQHGFAALAIDADWPDVLAVDRYLRGQGDDESAVAALASFARFPEWRWRNAELAELVEWMHGENRRRRPAARAGCYGLDLYAEHASIRAVLSYLGEVDPEAAVRARVRYAGWGPAAERAGSAEACDEELALELVEMQRRRTARSGRAPSGEAWFRAIQGTRVARRAEAYYRALVAGGASAFCLREVALADTLDLISAQLAAAAAPPRIVVWAHNAHVGASHDPGRRPTLGAVLRQRYPREVAIVGFSTHDGTVACAHAWDGPAEVEPLRPGAAGSWEQVFHGVGVPRFLVTAPALRRAAGEHAALPHRAIGPVYRHDLERWNHDAPARLAERYDVIVHVDRTSALEPLPRAAPEPRDAPDADPSRSCPTGP